MFKLKIKGELAHRNGLAAILESFIVFVKRNLDKKEISYIVQTVLKKRKKSRHNVL